MVACILAVAVLNIGLGFAVAVYLARPLRRSTTEGGQDETVDWASAALPPGDSASQRTTGPGAPATPFAAGDRGVVPPQTIEGLKVRVEQCNEYLSGLEPQGAGAPAGDSCGVAQLG